jgi:ABC-type Fe3+ transport system permease subunit
MPQGKPPLPNISSPFQRYGLAVLCVAIALGIALLLERYHFRGVEFPLFLFAIVLTVWYAGVGPAILAVIFCGLSLRLLFH